MASSISIPSCPQQNPNFYSSGNNYYSPPRVGPSSVRISPEFDVSKWKQWRICSCSSSTSSMKSIEKNRRSIIGTDNNNNDKKATVVYEKVDKWMEHSVVEIVKNLKESPLLVYVYDDDEKSSLKTQKSVQLENWGVVMEKWRKKETPLPEGVIFVEQLDLDDDGDEAAEAEAEAEAEEAITRVWGVVVQGKEAECGPVCYLLKTSRVVGSGLRGGGGMCCTHYCLMRVQSFRETAFSQLKNCWLIPGH